MMVKGHIVEEEIDRVALNTSWCRVVIDGLWQQRMFVMHDALEGELHQ